LELNNLEYDPVDLTFNFDLTNQTASANGVHIAGTFQGWDASTTEMTDPDNDGIYSYTHSFTTGERIEYKFINGDSWADPHDNFDSELSCVDLDEDAGIYNREWTVPFSEMALDPVCMNSCDACESSATNTHSLSFDGVDDYANIVELSTAIDNSSITLMGWFKSTSNGEPNIYLEGIFGFRNYPQYDGNYFALMNWTGWPGIPTIECYGGIPGNIVLTPSDDTWYHLTLVYDNTNAVFSTYLDGIQMAS
ncbi:uncharacterized protein METZ01_LOCUS464658, partial [marine metagenome]